ncbi:MAG: phosphoribosylformylglycinamidine synthase subunit PurQ [Kiritimatiellia bacterium]|nr:phosphoribosylformylglycinamidine synthase subunit PurQ [Kiritimatiellia bacterium]
MKPRVLIITGYGLNCEAESSFAWERAGAEVSRIHLHDLLETPDRLLDFSALMVIGGFSFGDHMTSGHVFAARMQHRMGDALARFVQSGRLILGVCNGFQILVKLGLLPAFDGKIFDPKLALMQNDCGRFINTWVTLRFEPDSPCLFTRGLDRMPLPIRHGEGKLFTLDRAVLDRLETEGCVACRYADPKTGETATSYPDNPNGSLNAIAGLCDPTGRIFGLMPHPEAYLFPENHPNWDRQKLDGKLPENGLGLKLFENAVTAMRA